MNNEIITALSQEAENIIIPQNFTPHPQKMLIIIPNMNLGGTLTVLIEMLNVFSRENYEFYIISSKDGNYKEKLLRLGAVVIIRPYANCSEKYKLFLQSAFDYIFINSATCHPYIYFFINTKVKVIWWLHETRTQLELMQTASPRSGFPHLGLLSSNILVAGVTPMVCRGIKELYNVSIFNLPMPIADCKHNNQDKNSNSKVTFFIPATYTYIKGQDLLLSAIAQLPKEYAEASEFVFCGNQLPEQHTYYEKIKEFASSLKNVVLENELDRKDVYEWYQKCDCVIAPSRLDSANTTIIEAMMFERLCIVSDAAGISEYMQDCVNGFIFPSENIPELLKRILLVIAEKESLGEIAQKGRYVYEQNFSIPSVLNALNSIM